MENTRVIDSNPTNSAVVTTIKLSVKKKVQAIKTKRNADESSMSPAKMDVKAKVRSNRTRRDMKTNPVVLYRVIMTVLAYAKIDDIAINTAKPRS